jgi:hypothetical protein
MCQALFQALGIQVLIKADRILGLHIDTGTLLNQE